ncbi:hypothetical protein MTR_8g468050 [Medicago truncatula]|uniref:Reverse transcriptase/retrotransposon-derived protein RNase H-like domain-containing protein n=1 Tax=Medicago truncatula TaxID=3880 RepID=A0A072TQT0_MEDTR|nr:hypothetical protein MTR_8g468050 [Medicago truncatula]
MKLTKTVTFRKPVKRVEGKFLTARQVESYLDEEARVFVMFASLKVESETRVGDFSIVNEFLDVLSDYITDLPVEREVEFAIDLVPSTSPILTAPYRMSVSELLCGCVHRRYLGVFEVGGGACRASDDRVADLEGEEICEKGFQDMKKRLTSTQVLILPNANESFVVYCDAFKMGLDGVLMHNGQVVVYSSRNMKIHKSNYSTHDLELVAVMFVL